MPDAVVVENLTYRYPDGQPALRGISLRVAEGETLALIGPNGAGKSTLLLHLAGLLAAQAGTLTVFGRRVAGGDLRWLRREVGLVFQNPDDQLFSPTVFDDVAFGPLNLGYGETEVRRAVGLALLAVGLEGYEGRAPHHLSLGEKKRAALATVLAMSPRLLVLDEPSANLDPGGKWALLTLLQGLAGTKVIVTHDLELVRELAQRVVVVDRGQVVTVGPTAAILAETTLLARHGLARPA